MAGQTISQQNYDDLVARDGPEAAAQFVRKYGLEIRPDDIEFMPVSGMNGGGEDGMEDDTDFAVADEDAADNTGEEDTGDEGTSLAVGGPKSDEYTDWETQQDLYLKKAKAQRLQQFNDAKAYIEKNYRGPSLSEQLFAMSQAFLSPTSMPGFKGTLANITPVFGQIAKAQRTADQDRAEALMKLQQQYQTGELGAEGDVLKNRLALIRARAAANKPQYIRTEDPVTGKVTITPVFPNGQQGTAAANGPTLENTRYIRSQADMIKLPPEIKYFIAVDDPNQTPRPIPGR
jgi:hypothetical protein